MKNSLLLLALSVTLFTNKSLAQADSMEVAPVARQASSDDASETKGPGRFNYTYLRLTYFIPSSGFGNPMAGSFNGKEIFSVSKDIPSSFCIGYESGKVRHFNKLYLGTDMLKLGINSGVGLQAFGSGKEKSATGSATTDGTYMVKLGVGPQFTFKPMADLRIGIFYRANIALVYTGYSNEEDNGAGKNNIDVHMLNYGYNGDIGLDVAYRFICIGFSYSMMQARLSKGGFIKPGATDDVNVYKTSIGGASTSVPIDPVIKFNRVGLSLGFAL